jgi:hypothetical protein
MKAQERYHRSQEVFDVLSLGLVTAAGVGFFPLGEPSVARSASNSARMRSMVVAGAHTPLEKTFRPFFSATTQWSPASFTRRVRAASPGGRRIQPSGAGRILPSAALTVFWVGPGVKVMESFLENDQSP